MTTPPKEEIKKELSDEEVKNLREMAQFWKTANLTAKVIRTVTLYIAGLLVAWYTIGEHVRHWFKG